jgi:hypothetical protein
MGSAPPQYSPDGRWWWDGEQWLSVSPPVPARARQRPARILLLGVAALVLLAAASGTVVVVGHQFDLARCLPVSSAMTAAIESGSSIPDIQLSHMRAVQSHDFQRVYFISARVTAPGLPAAVGTWTSNRLDPDEGLIFSVDDLARASTTWPADRPSMNDDGAQLSRDCVAER